ncbi:MAG: carbon-nitrogen hydrolase family protein [Thermoanaerobaculia bacterium]
MTFLAAACQMRSTSDLAENLRQAEALVREAAGRGALFVATPENTSYLGPHREKVRLAEPLDGPTCARFAALARELGIHLLLGSFAERADDAERCFNTSVLFSPAGERIATYRKLHLFDVDVPGGVTFRESDTVLPGRDVVVADSPLARIGLSICYDLRFGELYRALVERGAELLTIPSAFTATTGEAHWETLVRARAIESQAFVVAPGQWGRHDDGGLKESWGQSLIVDPWGRILAEANDGIGVVVAGIDLSEVRKVRSAIPMAAHRRLDRSPLLPGR